MEMEKVNEATMPEDDVFANEPEDGEQEQAAPSQDAGEGTQTEGQPAADQAGEDPFSLMFRFNHRTGEITSRKEAVKYVQLGKKYEAEEAQRKKIEFLAAARGQSPEEMIDAMIEAGEKLRRKELVDKYGDNEEVVEMLLQQYREGAQKTAEKNRTDRQTAFDEEEAAAQKDFENKLAGDVIALQKEFPEIKDFDSLPEKVKRAAITGEDLMAAYLKWQHSEGRKTAAAQKSAAAAAEASAGPVASGAEEQDKEMLAFLKGLE